MELDQFSIPFWQAFSILGSSRSIGMSVGPIPISEILSYFEINYIYSLEERLDYLHFIRILDNHYLKKKAEEDKSKKASKKSAPAPRRSRRR